MARKKLKPIPIAEQLLMRPPTDKRLGEIQRLMAIFKPERVTHITICIVASLFLLVCATMLLIKQHWELALGMFGATGVFTYSTGRLLRMWNDVIRILYGSIDHDEPKPSD